MAQERKVPVLRSDNSLIEQEFDSVREKFEVEMRKMEEEMSRFRSQLLAASERSRHQQHVSQTSSSTISSSTASKSINKQQQQQAATNATSSKQIFGQMFNEPKDTINANWLDELQSPLVQFSEEGNRVLKLRFDVGDYEPEQIAVKTIDNRLHVHAKREEICENSSMYREYNREFLLPNGTNPDLIRSSLSADGVLTVEAPLPESLASPS